MDLAECACHIPAMPARNGTLPFVKAHGLGNDFVILDLRAGGALPDAGQAARIADRRRGVGCDQLIVIAPPRTNPATVWMPSGPS